MITIREIKGDEEQFNWWLTIMLDAMLNVALLPKEVREELNYSIESLNNLEKYMIENYELEEIKESKNKQAFDLFARYIGETFRKNLTDIVWEMEAKEGWFGFGFPLLNKRNNKPFTKVSPASLVGGVLDRKSGSYLSNILKNIIEEEVKWEGRKK